MPSLTSIFSSVPFRGFYPDEQPEVPFRTEGTKQEKKRLAFLINKIARSSDFGKSVLERAAKAGYSISFDSLGVSRGAASSDLKKIILNPRCPDSTLTATLTHESRHAGQFCDGAVCGFFKEGRSFASLLKEERLMEADAVTSSVAVCFDLARNGDVKPLKKLRENYPCCVRAYEAFEGKGENQALTRSALAWFDDAEIKFLYEFSGMVPSLSCGHDIDAAETKRENPTSKQLISMICKDAKGGSYFSVPASELDTPQRAGISGITADWLKDHLKACRANGVKENEIDPTLKDIPVYTLPRYMQSNAERFYIYPDPLNERGMIKAQQVAGKRSSKEKTALQAKDLLSISVMRKKRGRN